MIICYSRYRKLIQSYSLPWRCWSAWTIQSFLCLWLLVQFGTTGYSSIKGHKDIQVQQGRKCFGRFIQDWGFVLVSKVVRIPACHMGDHGSIPQWRGNTPFQSSPMAQQVKNPPAMQETQETWVWSLDREDPLEKEMATHSSILAWRIPWAEEPGEPQSMGLKESNTTKWLKQQYSRMRDVLELAYTSSQVGSLCIFFQPHVQWHHINSLKSPSHGGETYPRKSAMLQMSSSLKLLAFTTTLLNRFNEKRKRFKRLY